MHLPGQNAHGQNTFTRPVNTCTMSNTPKPTGKTDSRSNIKNKTKCCDRNSHLLKRDLRNAQADASSKPLPDAHEQSLTPYASANDSSLAGAPVKDPICISGARVLHSSRWYVHNPALGGARTSRALCTQPPTRYAPTPATCVRARALVYSANPGAHHKPPSLARPLKWIEAGETLRWCAPKGPRWKQRECSREPPPPFSRARKGDTQQARPGRLSTEIV